ncbi:hypothetical protein RD110_05815 [Rhodoferax koreense]|uniref:Glycosyltransferase RgtA/B/C/D-like domain-containing protein n=1 Tax=Rhodoferax koreensis TaxID=1842727 RepID=A0A1P8JSP0_9BURK|nr:glycosyltransferase family 39 protein [Rhodoferax koreense]APW36766.1 hypothetical protein RD110_05815 [Rhodoferax koreense]
MKGRPRFDAPTVIALLALSAFAAFIFLSSPRNGDFWWFDSSRHAMNGVFIRDFILEGGLRHPIEYAKAYYEKYPGINIGFYPPFLYVTAAPFYALLGASHDVAQLVIGLYALGAGVCIYLICLRAMDGLTALAIAICVLASPGVLLWARQVQPDVPAAALLLATAYSLIRHLQGGRRAWLFATALCLGLAMLTRVQTVFAVPAVLFFVFGPRYEGRPALRIRLTALAIGSLVALPAVLMAAYFSQMNQSLVVQMAGRPAFLSWQNWFWYFNVLPRQIGWPAVVFVLAGIGAGCMVSLRRGMPVPMRVVLAMLCCSWLFFTVVSNKEPRFNLPSLPLLFILAAMGLFAVLPRLARVSSVLLAGWLVFQAAVAGPAPVVTGFKEAALLAQALTPPGANVLVSARRDGSFIFNMRTLGERRDIGVRRADKLFVEMRIMREMGIKDMNMSAQDILAVLDHEKIAVVVSQAGYLDDQPSMRNFHRLLEAGAPFEKVQTIPMTGDIPPGETELVVYRRK